MEKYFHIFYYTLENHSKVLSASTVLYCIKSVINIAYCDNVHKIRDKNKNKIIFSYYKTLPK